MVKLHNSLLFRITASFVVLVLLIASLTYVYTYRESRKALKETVREELLETVQVAAASLPVDAVEQLAALGPGDDADPAVARAAQLLYRLRAHRGDVVNYYIVAKGAGTPVFLVDDLLKDRPDDAAKVGEEYPDYDPELMVGFDRASVSTDFYSDKWGTFLSGYAPLRDSSGATIALLGADMKVTRVLEKMDFIGSLIYAIIGVAVLAAGLLVLFFALTVVREINALTAVARSVSDGHFEVQLPEIRSRNEIWELNEGLKSLVAAVKFMVETVSASSGAGASE